MYFLYILKCSDDSFYTGITNNLEARLHTHKEGKGSKYVRSRLPFDLVYKEVLPDHSSALIREHEIKSMTRDQKLQLIEDADHNRS
jgi:putative endonuclease